MWHRNAGRRGFVYVFVVAGCANDRTSNRRFDTNDCGHSSKRERRHRKVAALSVTLAAVHFPYCYEIPKLLTRQRPCETNRTKLGGSQIFS